jgi:hypothetical protein
MNSLLDVSTESLPLFITWNLMSVNRYCCTILWHAITTVSGWRLGLTFSNKPPESKLSTSEVVSNFEVFYFSLSPCPVTFLTNRNFSSSSKMPANIIQGAHRMVLRPHRRWLRSWLWSCHQSSCPLTVDNEGDNENKPLGVALIGGSSQTSRMCCNIRRDGSLIYRYVYRRPCRKDPPN